MRFAATCAGNLPSYSCRKVFLFLRAVADTLPVVVCHPPVEGRAVLVEAAKAVLQAGHRDGVRGVEMHDRPHVRSRIVHCAVDHLSCFIEK